MCETVWHNVMCSVYSIARLALLRLNNLHWNLLQWMQGPHDTAADFWWWWFMRFGFDVKAGSSWWMVRWLWRFISHKCQLSSCYHLTVELYCELLLCRGLTVTDSSNPPPDWVFVIVFICSSSTAHIIYFKIKHQLDINP